MMFQAVTVMAVVMLTAGPAAPASADAVTTSAAHLVDGFGGSVARDLNPWLEIAGSGRPLTNAISRAIQWASVSSSAALDEEARRVDRLLAALTLDLPGGKEGMRPAGSAIATNPDLSPALKIAVAVDRFLLSPNLEYASPAEAAGDVAECDVMDRPPHLCIGGEGDNVYRDDYLVSIDLGGDDRYLNSAGGADAESGSSVAVSIDLAGDDRYLATLSGKRARRVAQGGAAGDAIGILVDVQGEDIYEASYSESGGGSVGGAQGAGYESGLGVLADLQGGDSYRVISRVGEADVQADHRDLSTRRAMGQGASVHGTGILLDGGGNDSYEALSRPSDRRGLAIAQAGGAAVGPGLALLADSTGDDQVVIRALTKEFPANIGVIPRGIANSRTVALGMGFGVEEGIGLSLFGEGHSERLLEAASQGYLAETTTYGMGSGETQGIGILADGGGADSYIARAYSSALLPMTRSGRCACPETGAVTWNMDAGQAQTSAMGSGNLGAGLLLDAGGGDRYRAEAWSISGVRSAQKGSERVTGLGLGFRSATVVAQGAAIAGSGVMLDRGEGDDSYSSVSRTGVRLVGARPTAGGLNRPIGAPSEVLAQAGARAGIAVLQDQGGQDSYVASARIIWPDAVADQSDIADEGDPQDPEVQRRVNESIYSVAQGSVMFAQPGQFGDPVEQARGLAVFHDFDQGLPDSFSTTPVDDTCAGTRGEGVWRDCGHVGIGWNGNPSAEEEDWIESCLGQLGPLPSWVPLRLPRRRPSLAANPRFGSRSGAQLGNVLASSWRVHLRVGRDTVKGR